jgi:hypothetical protein
VPPISSRPAPARKTFTLPITALGKVLLAFVAIAGIAALAVLGWQWWIGSQIPPGPFEACQPTTPGNDFEAANQRDLQSELRKDSYFASGEDYAIAENATLTVPQGVTLIIEPGARVRFGEGARMVVEGTLLACGRGSRRILFTADATTGRPGYWAGIELRNPDPDTIVGHATFEFAGKDGHAPLWIEGGDARLEDVKFDSNQWYAISLDPDSLPQVRQPFAVENGPQGLEVRGGTMSKTREWAGAQPFIVNGVVEVSEKATLTIPAGGWVKFLPGGALLVRGEMSAAGAANQHVIFTSANDAAEENAPEPTAGDWAGLQFEGREATSTLAFVEIRYAGGDSQRRGCLWLANADPVLSDTTVSECATFSLSTDIAAAPTLERLTLTETDPAGQWELRESKLDGNTKRTLSKIFTADGNTQVMPVATGWVGVGEQATLVIDPGMTLLFQGRDRAGLWVDGKLQAEGTEQEPILLTSWRDPAVGGEGGAEAGDWAGLHLKNSRPDSTLLSYLTLRYGGPAGGDTGCLRLNSASPTITALMVSDCATYPISSDAASEPVVNGVTLTENAQPNQWEIRESSLEERKTWEWVSLSAADGSPVTRIVTGRVTIGQEATLKLQPGSVLKFKGGAGLVATGTLLAEGTAAQPILLTSWLDPEAGGSESGAQPGDWVGVLLDGAQAPKKLSFVQIRYAGSADRGVSCLLLNAAAPTLTDVSVSHCAYYPIGSDLASDPKVERLTLEDNQPADEWAVRESRLQNGTERLWGALLTADGQSAIVRVATGWLSIDGGAKLTLANGVVLKFGRGVGLWVGGKLVVEGDASRPVILTSWRDPEFSAESGAQAGDWVGVALENSEGGTRLSHLEVRYAGGDRNPRGAIAMISTSPQLADVHVSDSAWYPLSLDVKSAPQIESLTFENNSPANAVEVRASTLDTAGERVWSPWVDAAGQPLTRVVTGRLTINPDATLRLDPNTIVKFDVNGALDVYGGLLADGAVFTSLHDDEYGGDTDGTAGGERKWPGIQIHGRKLSHLQKTLVRYAQTGLWLEDAAPQIMDSRIEDSEIAALVADLRSAPTVSGLTLSRNAVNGLLVRADSLPEGETRWGVIGAPESQVVRVVQSKLVIGPRARLIIEPGVVIKFAAQSGLVIEGELQAGQAGGAIVTLTALADDAIGGDTDSESPEPNRGAWLGIAVNPNNTNAKLSLLGVNISYATIGLFLVNMPQWEFDALTVSNSQLYGLSCDAASLFVPEDPKLILLGNGAETLSCPTADR